MVALVQVGDAPANLEDAQTAKMPKKARERLDEIAARNNPGTNHAMTQARQDCRPFAFCGGFDRDDPERQGRLRSWCLPAVSDAVPMKGSRVRYSAR